MQKKGQDQKEDKCKNEYLCERFLPLTVLIVKITVELLSLEYSLLLQRHRRVFLSVFVVVFVNEQKRHLDER